MGTMPPLPPLPRLPPRPLALTCRALPIAPAAPGKAEAEQAGRAFEAMMITRLLKTSREARLGDDLMGGNDTVRDLIDEQRGRIVAQAAPLGLAQLLAREAGK